LEEARRIVKEKIAQGVNEKDIRDKLWQVGFTQNEIDGVISGDETKLTKQLSPPGQPKPNGADIGPGSRGKVIASAIILVLVFTLIPSFLSLSGPGGKTMDLTEVNAYTEKLEQKIDAEGGMRANIVMEMKSGRTTLTMSGTIYRDALGNERTDMKLSSSDQSMPTDMISISNDEGSFTGATIYSGGDYIWTRDDSSEPVDDYSGLLEDVDYYDQGNVQCGDSTCKKIFSNYQGLKITLLCREDGLCPSVIAESPTEYLKMELSDAVFGPQDASLFESPPEEEISDLGDLGSLGYY